MILAGIVLLLLGSAGLAFYLNTRPYVVLFQDMNETEATEVMTVYKIPVWIIGIGQEALY